MVMNKLTPRTNDFNEDYTILTKIGFGASGPVYSCQHKRTGLKYALKV
jgi:hypothetical protein